jgi:hypothetical protein
VGKLARVKIEFSTVIDTKNYPSMEDIEDAIEDLLKHRATWYLKLKYKVESLDEGANINSLIALEEWSKKHGYLSTFEGIIEERIPSIIERILSLILRKIKKGG